MLTTETASEVLANKLEKAGWKFLRSRGALRTYHWPLKDWPTDPYAEPDLPPYKFFDGYVVQKGFLNLPTSGSFWLVPGHEG